MKTIRAITFVRVKRPAKELLGFLYKNFSFSEESMISDYSKLYCKYRNPNKLKFDIILALYGNKIVGWGMATENLARHRKNYSYKDIFKPNSALIMLFVNKAYRNLGIASHLFRDLMKLCPRQHIIVIGHDKISWKFFSKFKKIHNRRITITDWR